MHQLCRHISKRCMYGATVELILSHCMGKVQTIPCRSFQVFTLLITYQQNNWGSKQKALQLAIIPKLKQHKML